MEACRAALGVSPDAERQAVNHTHVIAFLIVALAQAVLTIIICELHYRERRDILRRSMEADSVFEEPRERNNLR